MERVDTKEAYGVACSGRQCLIVKVCVSDMTHAYSYRACAVVCSQRTPKYNPLTALKVTEQRIVVVLIWLACYSESGLVLYQLMGVGMGGEQNVAL